jgi:S1-C subfamily serine protease
MAPLVHGSAGRLVRRLPTCFLSALLLTALVVAAPATSSAADAPAPTSEERAAVLAEPGVVLIDSSFKVTVRLKLPDGWRFRGKSTYSHTYATGYSGTGFVVNPAGLIVTASHVIEADEQEIRENAAESVRRDLETRSDDPDFRESLRESMPDCVQQIACVFTIKRSVDVYVPVTVAGTSMSKPLKARVLKSSSFDEADVAVLQVAGTNMPTVALATTVADLRSGHSLTVLGFPGVSDYLEEGQTQPAKLFGRVSNVRTADGSKLVEASITGIARGTSGGPAVDDDGNVIGLISYVTLDDGATAQVYLRTVDDIRTTLRGAGPLQAARGEVDTVFAQAMEYYWNHHYTAALPAFQKVLNLYDSHPLAKKYLSEAQAKAGGADDVPLTVPRATSADRLPVVPIAGVAAVVLLVLAVTFAIVARRRHRKRRGSASADRHPNHNPAPSASDAMDRQAPFDSTALVTGAQRAQSIEPEMSEQVASVGVATASRVGAGGSAYCVGCGSQLGGGFRFCPSCGQPVAAAPVAE